MHSPHTGSGAAQGFVEILVALLDRGEAAEEDDEGADEEADYFDEMLDKVVFAPSAFGSKDPCVREGVVWILVYMPPIVGEERKLPHYITLTLTLTLERSVSFRIIPPPHPLALHCTRACNGTSVP